MFSGKKKFYFQILIALTAVFFISFLTSCGPAPNPKLQAKAASSEEPREKPRVEENRSATPVEEPRAVAAAAPVEAPPPKPVAKPRQQTVSREVPSRPAANVRQVNDPTPSAARAPVSETASAPSTPAPL